MVYNEIKELKYFSNLTIYLNPFLIVETQTEMNKILDKFENKSN